MPLFDEWAEREEAVFIVGPPRSGTTVMCRTLSEAPGFWPARLETFAFIPGQLEARPLLKTTAGYLGERHDAFIAAADAEKLSAVALARLYFYEASKQYDSGRLIEKTPNHLRRIAMIKEAFPRSRILIMTRNPRDMVISRRVRHELDKSLGVDESELNWLRPPIDQLLRKFHQIDKAISSALRTWPDSIVCVSYDHLVESPATHLKAMGEKLGMPATDIDVMIGRATRERVAAPDETSKPARDAPIGPTARRTDMLTREEEAAIASAEFVHLRA